MSVSIPFKAYLEMTKLRTVALLTFAGFTSGVVGYVSSNPKTLHSLNVLMFSTIALAFACMGANAITSYIDRDIDALMGRTRRRPLPMGRIKPPERAVHIGLALLSVSVVLQLFFWLLWCLLDPCRFNL